MKDYAPRIVEEKLPQEVSTNISNNNFKNLEKMGFINA